MQAVELRQAYDKRVEALNAEASNHFLTVEKRIYTVASALRDSDNLMSVYELALDGERVPRVEQLGIEEHCGAVPGGAPCEKR